MVGKGLLLPRAIPIWVVVVLKLGVKRWKGGAQGKGDKGKGSGGIGERMGCGFSRGKRGGRGTGRGPPGTCTGCRTDSFRADGGCSGGPGPPDGDEQQQQHVTLASRASFRSSAPVPRGAAPAAECASSAVVHPTRSHHPFADFVASMAEMIEANHLTPHDPDRLLHLLQCYLRLNPPSQHHTIALAFLHTIATVLHLAD